MGHFLIGRQGLNPQPGQLLYIVGKGRVDRSTGPKCSFSLVALEFIACKSYDLTGHISILIPTLSFTHPMDDFMLISGHGLFLLYEEGLGVSWRALRSVIEA